MPIKWLHAALLWMISTSEAKRSFYDLANDNVGGRRIRQQMEDDEANSLQDAEIKGGFLT